jgi:hypothetical protein
MENGMNDYRSRHGYPQTWIGMTKPNGFERAQDSDEMLHATSIASLGWKYALLRLFCHITSSRHR